MGVVAGIVAALGFGLVLVLVIVAWPPLRAIDMAAVDRVNALVAPDAGTVEILAMLGRRTPRASIRAHPRAGRHAGFRDTRRTQPAQLGSSARLVLIPDAGHMVNMTHARQVDEALMELVERVSRLRRYQ